MKLDRNLKIWLGLSIISILVLLFWINRPMEIIPFLMKNDACFHQVADEYSEDVFEEIKRRTEAYPEYYDYYEMAKSTDSIAQNDFDNVAETDFKIQQKYVLNNLLRNPFDENSKYHKAEIEFIMSSFYDYSNEELAGKQLQNWSLNLVKRTMIQRNRIALLNYYEEKTGGTYGWRFDSAEPFFLSTSINTIVNEKTNIQLGFNRCEYLENVQLWINDEAAKVQDGKTRYQERTTKSGWNTLKIKYQGEYQKQVYTDSLTYRYYVCD